jgi:hypothetical protein
MTPHRSFNPYSAAPPPPSSLPGFQILTSTIQPLTNEQAGVLIDTFLQTQDGKVLALHRLADHLLGRKPTADDTEIQELENVLEEERRREAGVVHVQPEMYEEEEKVVIEEKKEKEKVEDKKKARKEERRIKKEMEREKRKREESLKKEDEGKKVKKEKKEK